MEIQEIDDITWKGRLAEVCFCPAKAGWGCIEQVQDCQQSSPRRLLLSYHVWGWGFAVAIAKGLFLPLAFFVIEIFSIARKKEEETV